MSRDGQTRGMERASIPFMWGGLAGHPPWFLGRRPSTRRQEVGVAASTLHQWARSSRAGIRPASSGSLAWPWDEPRLPRRSARWSGSRKDRSSFTFADLPYRFPVGPDSSEKTERPGFVEREPDIAASGLIEFAEGRERHEPYHEDEIGGSVALRQLSCVPKTP